jgi:GNAT superfamily N-acetyltransferase
MIYAIRTMRQQDKPQILTMMREFYASPAVLSNGSEEIFSNDIDNCVGNNPFIEGFVLEDSNGIQGYAMVAKSYSTEFGKTCVWIEDLYVTEDHRGLGLGTSLLQFITDHYTDCIFRLEVEQENLRAIRVYEKCGFSVLPYLEMKK